MNIIELISAVKIFERFAQTKIPAKLAYKIMKFCKIVATEEEFYNEKKNEIIDMYAVKDENGKVVVSDDDIIHIVQEKINEANEALRELNSVEIVKPDIRFTIEELEKLDLSVSDMFILDAFIEE